MDASDWVRIRKLTGSRVRPGSSNVDVVNPPPNVVGDSGRKVYTEFGTSKTRRPASNWTDYIASQNIDYVLESVDIGNNRILITNKICTCDTTNPVKKGLCPSCIPKL
jgi:hypothetical protein